MKSLHERYMAIAATDHWGMRELCSEAIEKAEKLEAALASARVVECQQWWIPVESYLPHPDVYVLVHNGKWTGVGKYVTADVFEHSERWQSEVGEFIEHLGPKVTHWMPLPPAPGDVPLNVAVQREPEDFVQWIVNDNAELGVMVGGNAYFLYKGESFMYKDGAHDDGTPVLYRPVGKREFGECCHPIKFCEEPLPRRYTERLKFTPGLSFGQPGDGAWRELPKFSDSAPKMDVPAKPLRKLYEVVARITEGEPRIVAGMAAVQIGLWHELNAAFDDCIESVDSAPEEHRP